MDPADKSQSTPADPRTANDSLTDDIVAAFLRAHAPGLPATRFDARAVTSRARAALRHRRRLRHSVVALAAAATAYLTLAVAGPLLPGLGTVSMPGGDLFRALAGAVVPGIPPGPGQWHEDVDRLDAEVLPVVEELELFYYLLESGPCQVLEYPRGGFRDGDPACLDLVPFDAEARVDFDLVTDAIKRSGVPIERIFRHDGSVYIQLDDYSWQYNWAYVYMPDGGSPPATSHAGEEWTRVRGDWWFHRSHDD